MEVNSLIMRGLFKNMCNNVIPLRYQPHIDSTCIYSCENKHTNQFHRNSPPREAKSPSSANESPTIMETENSLPLKNKKPTRCHVLFYCTSYRLNMFRALLCLSSGARDYDVDYHIGLLFLVCCMMEDRCG